MLDNLLGDLRLWRWLRRGTWTRYRCVDAWYCIDIAYWTHSEPWRRLPEGLAVLAVERWGHGSHVRSH